MQNLSKLIFSLIFALFLLVGVRYLLIPNPPFPSPPPDALQSREPADTETPLRRAYFTDYTRDQVIKHYEAQWQYLPTLNLNYPPEEAQVIIRDQTRSTYLEELVHPMRESLFINGFEPQKQKDDIWINKRHFAQKITVRFVPSPLLARLIVFVLASAAVAILVWQWRILFAKAYADIAWKKIFRFFVVSKP